MSQKNKSLTDALTKIASVDIFEKNGNGEISAGHFVGRPFHIDYEKCFLLVADAWKLKANGLPHGTLLLAYYENETDAEEALLLRVVRPTKLPTDSDVISSMVEYYKDNMKTAGEESRLDTYTRYEFSFSGIECRVLGTFYRDKSSSIRFGADAENFYSAHNYSVWKPNGRILEIIANLRDGHITGKPTDIRIGYIRYSSSQRMQDKNERVPVYVTPNDFLGKRTALFGMTRTGKSNTVKKIIEASCMMSGQAAERLSNASPKSSSQNAASFNEAGVPKFPVGQIIFDVNGEYANANLQDEGTAIFEIYKKITSRYSVTEKPDFKVMKVNFYKDISSGFELIRSHLLEAGGDYIGSFTSVDMGVPEDYNDDMSVKTRHDRKVAAYFCCLFRAGFTPPPNFTVRFEGNKDLNKIVKADESLDPSAGISLQEACIWFEAIWDAYDSAKYFSDYKKSKGHEWADEDLKAILVFLTRKRTPGRAANVSGYRKLNPIVKLHTNTLSKGFEIEIVEELREGKIVIVDISQGDPEIQILYSERICRRIFNDAMNRFVRALPNNFIQFYFEEAHNLFPKKEDKDYKQIYNRIAKEGAKLNLGMVYATQEVSSISSNILKNTQNWFIAHLNNDDETKEIRKFYDFEDFVDGLTRFSANNDKGFVRMKTYSNPFVVPVQIDRFLEKKV